ncbi:hypothetical protein [Citrobacter sp. JGM124]|uniref:hypothetical protein n=1 Tax=Citrobacter sp. JGM124 TaxID=2799789 RepID=UPI001BA8B207|nr:hypothetical protein [Citrobacter sp. JGM124]MBS0847586.1 hypothetical protein [Citrobacter sp. JGM124]
MDSGVASVIAAIIAAAAAVVGLVITKENKTSEFRQNWIDGLREELAELMECFLRFRTCSSKDRHSVRSRINFLSAKIRLRLSSDSPSTDETKLLIIINSNILNPELNIDCTEIVNQYFISSARILKAEWKRVKRGEIKYRIAVAIAYLILSIFASYYVFETIYFVSQAIDTLF